MPEKYIKNAYVNNTLSDEDKNIVHEYLKQRLKYTNIQVVVEKSNK